MNDNTKTITTVALVIVIIASGLVAYRFSVYRPPLADLGGTHEKPVNVVTSLPPYEKTTTTERVEKYIDSEKVAARYEVSVPDYKKLIGPLYDDRDFGLVQRKIEAAFDLSGYAHMLGHYMSIVSGLGSSSHAYEYGHVQSVLRDWSNAAPDSWIPILISGIYNISASWDARGSGYAHTVSEEAANEHFRLLNVAQRELERAYTLNPQDSVISTKLITVAMAMSSGREAERHYYERALKSKPFSVDARETMYTCLLAKWGGSWEEVTAFVKQEIKGAEDNPNLFYLQENFVYSLYRDPPRQRDIYDDPELIDDMVKLYANATEHDPVHLSTKIMYMIWVRRSGDADLAYQLVQEIGDRFTYTSEYKTPERYHFPRIIVMRNYAREQTGEKQVQLYEELMTMSHNWPDPWVEVGQKLLKEGEKEKGIGYLARAAELGTSKSRVYYTLIHEAIRTRRFEDAQVYIDCAETMPFAMDKSGRVFLDAAILRLQSSIEFVDNR